MDHPSVRYAETSDGRAIAYCIAGRGAPLVLMPWPVLGLALWRSPTARPFLDALANRFRLVHYDARGQGLSSRGLSEDHCIDEYLLDLEAVIEAAKLKRFVLVAGPLAAHVGTRFAARHPDRIAGLVIYDTSITGAWNNGLAQSGLAQRDWDLFLHAFSSSFWIDGDRTRALQLDREAINQADFLLMTQAASRSNIRELLPELSVPTLVMAPRMLSAAGVPAPTAEDARVIAGLIPDARLVLFDVFGDYFLPQSGGPPAAVTAISDFVSSLPGAAADTGPVESSAQLTARESDVLRLIAAGSSNQEIAEALVLSVRTVERHITNLYGKIGARRKAEATAYAIKNGLA